MNIEHDEWPFSKADESAQDAAFRPNHSGLLTGGAYAAIQLWVQARWMRRTLDVDASYKWASALLLVTVFGLLKLFASAYVHKTRNPPFDWMQGVLMISGLVFYLGTTSCMKGELGRAPLRLELWEWPAFFLGPLYYQYQLNRLTVRKPQVA
jgi:hypothetical protein